MLRIIVFASAAALYGCSGNYHQMDAWMGLSKQSVLDNFDRPPDAVGRDVLGEWMQWRRHIDRACSDRFSFKNTRVVGYSSDCGTWGGWSVPLVPTDR